MASGNILEVKNLSVEFNGNLVLDGLDFSLPEGEVLAIVGPNGAGKTVLFRTLLGLLPYSGSISWRDGVRIGYVPQRLSIESSFPLTVREFLLTRPGGKTGKEHEAGVLRSLEAVGVRAGIDDYHLRHHLLDRQIGLLSGGELQRILIARSLIGDPDVILFDEPTSGIDVEGEETIYELLERLQKSSTLTILLISHDLNIIYRYTDKVLCLNRRMLAMGKPKLVLDQEGLAKLYGNNTEILRHEHDFHH